MNTPEMWLILALSAVAGVLVGALGCWLIARARVGRLEERIHALQQEYERVLERLRRAEQDAEDARATIARQEAQLDAERRHGEEKLRLLTQAREELTQQFKNLSQEILEEKSKRFTQQNKESLDALLKPLGERLEGFQKQVRDTYSAETRERAELKEQIRQLRELNQQIAEDAVSLTNALKGESKTQGNWGEMILETVLERSGLLKGQQYDTQLSASGEEGGRRVPDAVIYLPENRCIVVDSKVSLNAYLRVHEADDEDARQAALNEHLESVRRHLKQLSDKDYHQLPAADTLDYVFMFVPSEAAYVEALRADFSLQREALDKNIAIVSPTTLMPMLRAIGNLWRLQQQEANAAEIARRAGQMYDKFKSFLDDMDKLDRGLRSATTAYDEAKKKLVAGRGNLVTRAEKLHDLGAAASKRIGQDWRSAAAIESGEESGDDEDD